MGFTAEELKERQRVASAMMGAWTLSEVRSASENLRSWRLAHPEDEAIVEGGEMLSHASDYAELRDAESRMLGFRGDAGLERERVFVQAEKAHDLAEIAKARRELLLWRWDYPCDREKVNDLLHHLDDQEVLMHVIDRELNTLDDRSLDTAAMPYRDAADLSTGVNQSPVASVA